MPGTIPLYRYVRPGPKADHFYTTNAKEIGSTVPGEVGQDGYTMEGIEGYCFGSPKTSTVPLYVYYKTAVVDHLYTTNMDELGKNTPRVYQKKRYEYKGIACHVLPV